MANGRPQTGARRWLSRAHRWLGLGSIAFVLLLSVTGIVLNHSTALNLDSRYIRSPDLLEWYGLDVPKPAASFATAGHRASLVGERLYFDGVELADEIMALVGIVATPSFLAVATPRDVLLVMADGSLVERVDTRSLVSSELTAIGAAGDSIVLRTSTGLYETDENMLAIDPCSELDFAEIHWSTASVVPDDQLAVLEELYRGRGLSLEQVVLDLHSGKILSRVGPILLDIVGFLFIALSFLGVFMWFGRNGNHRTSN